ncbi:MAG: vitamin K-dependent gamma-carboxylase [Hyphomicrobiaceae bacterium]|jgi:vitamin K-dependent gamma-carboxylase
MIWQLSLVEPYFVDQLAASDFFVTYDFFHWVHLPSREVMQWMFPALYAAAGLVALGLWYRPAIVVLAVGWTWLFLSCRGHYANHYYLFCLLAALFATNNAHRALSLDRWLFPRLPRSARTVPNWQITLVRAQLLIVYFFCGIAKLESHWLTGCPMRASLARRTSTLPCCWTAAGLGTYRFVHVVGWAPV